MLLTIVTVVFNDLPGLRHTLNSVEPLLGPDVQYWIINGSTEPSIQSFIAELNSPHINIISETDDGLYDAMNKGLMRAKGDYVLFMNAGDQFDSKFDIGDFFRLADDKSKVILGYSIEEFEKDIYLRPGLKRERLAFKAPSHQATFYPREYYSKNSFDTSLTIKADGRYTGGAISACGAIFVPRIVCRFSLGGLSSNYGNMRVVRRRLKDRSSLREGALLLAKTLIWHAVPQRTFYRILALPKYTKLADGEEFVPSNQTLSA